jgi:catechol-2,3-dioxygenase
MIVLQGLDHVALIVRDVARSAAWYQQVLGLERCPDEGANEAPVLLRIGSSRLALFPCRAAEPRPVPGPDTLAAHHIAFRVDRANFVSAQETLLQRSTPFEFQDHIAARSLYFRDPDGHQIEITTDEVGE